MFEQAGFVGSKFAPVSEDGLWFGNAANVL